MTQPSKQVSQFYPEDLIAISVSGIIVLVQIYCFWLGMIKDVSEIIIPAVSSLVLTFFIIYRRSTSSKTIKFLSSYQHIPFYGIIFSAFQSVVHKLNPNDYDSLLLKIDMSVFGFDITRSFEPFISNGLTEILTLSYFSYYVLPTLTFVLLYFKKESGAFTFSRQYLLAILIAWYSAFVFYILLPAAGPDIAFPEHYTITLQGLSPITNTYLNNLGQYLRESFIRNTFPSLHFGIILITNYFAYRLRRKYFLFCTLPLGTLLAIATVYLRQHYLIDLVGSLPLAAISIYLSIKIIDSGNKKEAA
ncbi:MAG: phosphatase PAP2 family protein [Ignavibacteria bacterium]|nr:phosphatase PAP2 family protein [Ignavibacteria bacterium]